MHAGLAPAEAGRGPGPRTAAGLPLRHCSLRAVAVVLGTGLAALCRTAALGCSQRVGIELLVDLHGSALAVAAASALFGMGAGTQLQLPKHHARSELAAKRTAGVAQRLCTRRAHDSCERQLQGMASLRVHPRRPVFLHHI